VKAYEVVLERDESGTWIARVPAVPGCHTYGCTIEQARRRIREALGLWVDDAERAELRFHVRLPDRFRREVTRSLRLRREQERTQTEAQESLRLAARSLTREAGLSLRDTADLLEISHQRVAQLVESRGRRRRA